MPLACGFVQLTTAPVLHRLVSRLSTEPQLRSLFSLSSCSILNRPSEVQHRPLTGFRDTNKRWCWVAVFEPTRASTSRKLRPAGSRLGFCQSSGTCPTGDQDEGRHDVTPSAGMLSLTEACSGEHRGLFLSQGLLKIFTRVSSGPIRQADRSQLSLDDTTPFTALLTYDASLYCQVGMRHSIEQWQ